MVFNKEGRDMLRLAVTEKIKELKSAIDHKDEFKRLTIKKDWIEPLLFDEHIDKEGYHYKTIGYTYDDIRYIDLSNVSFEDVSFDFRNYDCNKNLTKEEKDKMILNLNGTNAKIDFMKTYEMRKYKQLNLSNVCFSGLDLSNNNYVDENGVSVFHNALVINCDFRGTGLKITTPEVHFYDSNLYCVDLSELEMHLYDVMNSFSNCDLRDTGLNIKIYDSVNPDSIAKAMQNPNYEGCRLGKTIITSNREKGERAAGIYYDYEAWRNAMIDDICYDLDKQVNGSKNKTLKKELPSDPVKFMKQVKGDLYMGN